MNRLKSLIVLILGTLIVIADPNMTAQETPDTIRLSVEQAKALALTNNKSILAAQTEVEIARKKVAETVTIGLPQVKMDASYQHVFKTPEFAFPTTGFTQSELTFSGGTPEGFTQFYPSDLNGINQYVYQGEAMPIMEPDNATFDFTVSQLIFSGEYIVGLQASKVYKTISEQSLKKDQLDIIQQVETTYYMILIANENLTIVQENLALTEKTLHELEQMLEAGFIEDTEVDQLRLNLSVLKNLEISIKGQIRNTYNLLKYQMGVDFSQNITVTDPIETLTANLSPSIGNGFDVNQNIEYQMIDNQVAISKLNVKREKSTFLPTLSAFYRHREYWIAPPLSFEPDDILGASLSIPIFTSGQRLHKVKQASLTLDKSEIQKSQLRDGLQLKYQNLLLNYETAYNNYLNQKENREISRSIFEKTSKKVKEGLSSSLELTQVQGQYLESVGNYYSTVMNLINTRTELERLLSNKL